MLRDGGNILLIRADDQQYLPYGKCAALDIGLPAGRGVTEINESEFRTSEPFLNQTRAGIAWRPAMANCHAFKTISALSGQAHTDDDGPSWAHEFLPKAVTIVSIVAHALYVAISVSVRSHHLSAREGPRFGGMLIGIADSCAEFNLAAVHPSRASHCGSPNFRKYGTAAFSRTLPSLSKLNSVQRF